MRDYSLLPSPRNCNGKMTGQSSAPQTRFRLMRQAILRAQSSSQLDRYVKPAPAASWFSIRTFWSSTMAVLRKIGFIYQGVIQLPGIDRESTFFLTV